MSQSSVSRFSKTIESSSDEVEASSVSLSVR